MSVVLVTGGTGHLGRDLVRRLVHEKQRVRVFARKPGPETDVEWAVGDLATGDGLMEALQDVHTVINAATFSPIARRGGVKPIDFFRSPSAVDVDGTRRLLEFSTSAKVGHLLHVSIVGLEEASLPYARVKLEGERLVRGSSVSWSIVRATPFYYLLERFLAGLNWLPVWPMPKAVFNPVDTSDVAAYLTQCAFDGKRGIRDEIGGPDDLSCADLARDYQQVRGVHRPIVPLPVSAKRARGMGFVSAQGRRGTLSWLSWLRQQSDGGSQVG